MTPTLLGRLLSHRARAYAVLVTWCAALIVARALRSGAPGYFFLCWNLFLAGIPAAASLLFAHDARPGAVRARAALWFALWLLFLPNAPYLITDFIHLRPRAPVPLWFDVALMASFAGAGLLLGYGSVAEVHDALARLRGRATGWTVALLSLLLSGYGIYLGRFVRWNSWDALAHPAALFGVVSGHAQSGAASQPLTVTLVYGPGLALGYIAVRWLARSGGEAGDSR